MVQHTVQQGEPSPVEQAAEAHAQHIVAGDTAAMAHDCVPMVLQTPEDLYAQLGTARFERYAIVGHAKIGLQHVFKVRYFGPTVLTLHHRFGSQDERWVVLESERV
jgi:hypothetical protein